jgi:lysyl-tRNA synthetase class 2
MKWHEVKSSVFKRYAYEWRPKRLYLHFKRGGIYCYHQVPQKVRKELVEAASKGGYFNLRILDRFEHKWMGRYVV